MLSYGFTTYTLTESSIQVTNRSLGDSISKTLYSKTLSKTSRLLTSIKKIRLDSLKNFYFNQCVMITSGDEYYLDFTNDLLTKKIHLHHYYLEQIDEIVKLLNNNLPKKHRFSYVSRDIEQDCDFFRRSDFD